MSKRARTKLALGALLVSLFLGEACLAQQTCASKDGKVAHDIGASLVDLGLSADGKERRFLQFQTPLPVTTDGAPDSYNSQIFTGPGSGVNNICNAIAAYKLDEDGNRTSALDRPKTIEAFQQFRDHDWTDQEGVEIPWQGGIVGAESGDRIIPCVFAEGQYKGYLGSKTNLKNGLSDDKGECEINDQIDPRKIAGVTIEGGRNFIRDAGVQLGDLAVVSTNEPAGSRKKVFAIVVDSGGVDYPAMGTIALNAALLGKEGPFDTRKSVLGLSIDKPATVTIIPGSFGFRLERPYTAENVKQRLNAFLEATKAASWDDLIDAVQSCRSGQFIAKKDEKTPLEIAVAGPLSGPEAMFGAQMAAGVALAAEDVNASGGILQRKIDVRQGDDRSEPGAGAAVAERLSDEGVKFVIGHFNSSVTIAASEIYARKGVLFITPSASDPTVTDQGLWNAFRLAPRADEVGRAWGEYAGKKLRDKKIAIVSDEARFSRLLLGAARASMEAAGVKEVFHGDVSAGGSDYSGLAAKLLAANTDYVMWAAPPAGAVEVLRQMRDAGSTAHALIWADVLAGGEIRALGGPSIEGLLTAHIRESVDSAAAQDLFAKLRARGVEPGDFGLYSYVGVQILKEAAEKARSLEPRAVAEIMRSGGAFSTAIGDVAFDKSGDRKDPDFVWYALIPSGEGNYKLRPQE